MVPGGFMVLAMTDEPYFLNSCMSSPWYKKFLKTGVAGAAIATVLFEAIAAVLCEIPAHNY